MSERGLAAAQSAIEAGVRACDEASAHEWVPFGDPNHPMRWRRCTICGVIVPPVEMPR